MPTKAKSNEKSIAEKGKATRFVAGAAQVETARKGAIAANKVKQEKKIIKEEILKRMSEKDWEEMMTNMIQRAKGTDKGFEVFRDSIGQKPAQEVNLVSDAEEFEFKFKYSK